LCGKGTSGEASASKTQRVTPITFAILTSGSSSTSRGEPGGTGSAPFLLRIRVRTL
jgi:hypothetical protein